MRRLAALLALMLAPAAFANEPVELTFIANEGVILRQGEYAVAIDTPSWNSYEGTYAIPSEAMVNALTTGTYPAGRLDAMLFTHIHGDHFDASGAAGIIEAQQPPPLILGGDQVIDAFVEAGGDEQRALRPVVADGSCGFDGDVSCRSEFGLRSHVATSPSEYLNIDARPLFHRAGISHWTYRVEMGGVSVLHLGDTQPQLADFSIWDGVDFDVILYPYWFAQMEEGAAFLAAHPNARTIAFHIPANASSQRVIAMLNGADYLHTEGETRILGE